MAKRRTIPQPIKPYVVAYLIILQKKRNLPITAAYVFGSWAKGTQHQDSDIDMCIVSPKLRNWDTKIKQLSRAQYDDLLNIEPHGFTPKEFNPEEDPLVYEIVKYGIRVI